jgi:hypothetical protein
VKSVLNYFQEIISTTRAGWDRFWFKESDPATLSLIRILAGGMLFYTHAIWAWNSNDFFAQTSWLSPDAVSLMQQTGYQWSHLWWFDTAGSLAFSHVAALTIFGLLTVGLCTRYVSVLAFFVAVSYAHRTPGALFGLDQINTLLAFYLMLAPCGARYSLDSWLKNRQSEKPQSVKPTISANIATRLIQVHLCVIYLFAGLSKLQGEAWWNGTAIWGGIANYEYQSLNMTWLADWPLTINALTHCAVLWEVSFCVLIWNRLTRPIVLAGAVALHAGIALCLGMITFGTIMIVANMSFVKPELVRALLTRKQPEPEQAESNNLQEDNNRRLDSSKHAVPGQKSRPVGPKQKSHRGYKQ